MNYSNKIYLVLCTGHNQVKNEHIRRKKNMDLQQLLDKGYTQEQATEIMGMHKESLKGYVPQSRLDEVIGQRDTLQTQVTERDTQITTLKAFEGTNEELQTKITELETENAAQKTKYESELEELNITNGIRDAFASEEFADYQPKDLGLIIGLLDKSLIKLDGNKKLSGNLLDQVKAIHEDKSFLFEEKQAEEQKPSNPFQGFKPIGKKPGEGEDKTKNQGTQAIDFGKGLAAMRNQQRGYDTSTKE